MCCNICVFVYVYVYVHMCERGKHRFSLITDLERYAFVHFDIDTFGPIINSFIDVHSHTVGYEIQPI